MMGINNRRISTVFRPSQTCITIPIRHRHRIARLSQSEKAYWVPTMSFVDGIAVPTRLKVHPNEILVCRCLFLVQLNAGCGLPR